MQSPPSPEYGIEFKKINMKYADGTTAIKSLDLSVNHGEFVVLVGPSGCGKSTALRILAGLEQATGGTITINGHDVTERDPQERDIAMIFQSYALYPHKTVFDNIAYPLKLRRVSTAEVAEKVGGIADLLGLTPLLNRKPGALSGGERQRVAMGRAMVRNPQAFLMDEPLSNLDAALRVEMRGEIRRLHRRLGVTTVYVTHDQVEAMTMGDRVAVLRGGDLQQFDVPQKLYEQSANMFVASFIGSPAINLCMSNFDRSTGVLRIADNNIVLPADRIPKAGIDGEVMVGIRPEAFNFRRDTEHDQSMTIVPDIIESLGSELLVHFELAAARVPIEMTAASRSSNSRLNLDVNSSKTVRFIAKLDACSGYQIGQPANVWYSTDHIMIFETGTGETVLPSKSLVAMAGDSSSN
jgi:multiple sugar transport system ATP-binding protein